MDVPTGGSWAMKKVVESKSLLRSISHAQQYSESWQFSIQKCYIDLGLCVIIRLTQRPCLLLGQ